MFSTKNLTKPRLIPPKFPAKKVVDEILGQTYDLSLVFVDNKKSHDLNLTWRHKDKPTNILSFPLSPDQGEIFINLRQAKAEAKNYQHTYAEHLLFLLIHGCLHLKGMRHSSTMEKAERHFFVVFQTNVSTTTNRSGHRDRINPSGRLRTKKG